MTNIEAMKLALEALEAFLRFAAIHHDGPDTSDKYLAEDYAVEGFRKARQVLPALRTAIETAEKQEPVAWMHKQTGVIVKEWSFNKDYFDPLYTHPPAAQRQPLPAHEIVTMYEENPTSDSDMIAFARAIEAAHGIKEKNT